MKRILALFFAVGLLFTCLLSGCAKEEELTHVTVSEVTHSVFYAPQYAAIKLGYFEEEGLEVEPHQRPGGG